MALGAYITSKENLIQYIKEILGSPVINVEVTDTQIEHAINLALNKFTEFAEGGIQMRFTTFGVEAGTQEYDMPYDTYSVIKIFDSTSFAISTTIFNDKNLIPAFQYYPLFAYNSTIDMATIYMSQQYVESLDFLLKVKVMFDFNSITKKLYFMEMPTESYTAGMIYYQQTDYTANALVYDESWIKRYSASLVKKQWGHNLTKYQGSILPAGLQLNGQGILDEANREIEVLNEELELVWRLPPDFFVG